MAPVSLSKAAKYFGSVTAVQEFDLEIANHEFVVLVGPSGCGKSTVLRMIAGLEGVSSGQLRIGERVVDTLSPGARDVAMVFQSYALCTLQQKVRDSRETTIQSRRSTIASRIAAVTTRIVAATNRSRHRHVR